jgi:hypothetical protein
VFGKFNIPPEVARFVHEDVLHAFITVGSWMIATVFLNHIIACAWFGLGSSFPGMPTWVQACKQTYLLNANVEPSLMWYYATALHWTLTQFTPASMEVVPENTYERLFNVFVILAAIIVFSTFLSSIAGAVAVFRRKHEEHAINRANLLKFLQENHVSRDLASRIQGFLKMQRNRRGVVHRIHESAVPQLKQLPEPIKEQLACEIFMPVISICPVLKSIKLLAENCAASICLGAMSQQSILAFQEVFCLGNECKVMYFIVAGEMAYFHGASTKPMSDCQNLQVIVSGGSWVCEYVLFVAWEHCGLMITMGMPCELVLLDAAAFQALLRRWPQAMHLCRAYALALLASREESGEDLSDLPVTEETAQNLVEAAHGDSA